MKDIAVEYEVNYSTVKKWKKEVILHLPELLGRESSIESEFNKGKLKNKQLKEQLKKKEEELDFLKRKKFLISLLQK